MDSQPTQPSTIGSQIAKEVEAPIVLAYSELASQIAYLDDVVNHLGTKLEPVRNIYPQLKDDAEREPTPPKSQHRQVIDAATDRIKRARFTLEQYVTELEV